jgi:hypothetical protein
VCKNTDIVPISPIAFKQSDPTIGLTFFSQLVANGLVFVVFSSGIAAFCCGSMCGAYNFAMLFDTTSFFNTPKFVASTWSHKAN